jgi:hypothetical protein
MSKVVLSNGYEFELYPNGVSTSGDTISFTFVPDESTLEQLEEQWTGNTKIQVMIQNSDIEESIGNYHNYTLVDKITKYNRYSSEVVTTETGEVETDEDGNQTPITTSEIVYKVGIIVTVSKPSLESRLEAVEQSMGDVVSGLLLGM